MLAAGGGLNIVWDQGTNTWQDINIKIYEVVYQPQRVYVLKISFSAGHSDWKDPPPLHAAANK